MLTTVGAEATLFPAASVQPPTTEALAASPLSTTSGGGDSAARPEPLSAQWKRTVTLLLFQPLASGDGMRSTVSVGGVLSSRTSSECGASTLPALSVAKNDTVVTPSVLMIRLADAPPS